MAVTAGYLAKLARAVRIKTVTNDVAAELTDLVNECRADLQSLGVLQVKTDDETDSLIFGAVRCFVRWKLAPDEKETVGNRDDYMQGSDELRRKRDYTYLAITFTVTSDGTTPLADAEITFNGETKATASNGQAVFYYVSTGTNQAYTVVADGYTTKEADLDVTASASVTVNMGV